MSDLGAIKVHARCADPVTGSPLAEQGYLHVPFRTSIT
jgi:hypothetical protein